MIFSKFKYFILFFVCVCITSCNLQIDYIGRHERRGAKLFYKGKFEKAISHLDKAIARDSTDLESRMYRAIAYDETGEDEKCLEEYKYLSARGYKDPDFYLHYSIVHFDLKNFHQAFAYIDSAIATDSTNMNYVSWKAFYLFETGEIDKSIDLNKKVNEQVEDPFALKTIGDAYYQKREFKEAVYFLDRAVKAGQKDFYAYISLAWAYAKTNDSENACKYYRLAEKSLEKGEVIDAEYILFCK